MKYTIWRRMEGLSMWKPTDYLTEHSMLMALLDKPDGMNTRITCELTLMTEVSK